MGVLDKIKNALFEVEYVEVDEPPKKEKKNKFKEKEETNIEKPIAKKIVLPGKKEEKVEVLKEEELKDEDFEVRPMNDSRKEEVKEEFKFMEDKDFQVDEDEYVPDEPEILQVIDKVDYKKEPEYYPPREKEVSRYDSYSSDRYENKNDKLDSYYNGSVKKNNSIQRESKPYGLDNSYKVQVHEYGTYERKEDKTNFKPSPIISPIYGILDKNYRKEDVVSKKDVRVASSFSRANLNVDDIRNKAYGEKEEEEVVKPKEVEATFEVEEEEENLLVDLSDDNEKPEVKEITMGDALEYFQDLGLEYNVDYVDASKERSVPKRTKGSYGELEDVITNNMDEPIEEKKVEVVERLAEETVEEELPKKTETANKVVDIIDESDNRTDPILDDDDNLFDLIDSMYQEND